MIDDDYTPEESHEGQLPAAPSSGLAGLRAQREKIVEKLYLDHRVPRYETPVYVRLSPADGAVLARLNNNARKSKDPAAAVKANAQLLAQCCVGVFEKDADGNPVGSPEDWPKFDEDLAGYLGHPELKRAADVVQKLFLTDGDIAAAVNALTTWSGYVAPEADEEYEGN